MNRNILQYRHNALSGLMRQTGVEHILFLQPGLENIDLWLFASETLPTPAPFNRNNAYIYSAGGEIISLCQTTTHPTDCAQFPHFEDTDLSAVFTGAPVGIVNPRFLKKNVREHLISCYPAGEFVDMTNEFYRCKALKTPEEIDGLRAAAAAYDRLFTAMPLALRPHRLEKEVVNELRQRLAWQGAESETPGFHTMVSLSSAPDGARSVEEPLLWPGRRLCEGDRVNVAVRGYPGNGFSTALGRSFVLGKPSAEAQACWDLAVAAQQLASGKARPGATLREIEAAVNDFLAQNSLPSVDNAWIHGVGTSAYEAPRNVDASSDWLLQEGMVLAIGPEIKPDGKDAYCCLDIFCVTENGAERLTQTPRILRYL